jgi:hypothetical protein
VACTADGKLIAVAHAGTHELSAIDRIGLHAKLAREAAAAGASSDLSFLTGLRRRIKLAGQGPRGLAVIGSKAYAAEYYSDSLAVVGLSASPGNGARSVTLGPKTDDGKAKGEVFFTAAYLRIIGLTARCATDAGPTR